MAEILRDKFKIYQGIGITLILLEILGGSLIILGIYTQIIALFLRWKWRLLRFGKWQRGINFSADMNLNYYWLRQI